MGSEAVTVPFPSDDHGSLGTALESVGRAASELNAHSDALRAAAASAAQQWVGAAAEAFSREHAQGLEHIARVIDAHGQLAQHISPYHGQIALTQDAAKGAHGAIQAAIGTHNQTAGAGVAHLNHRLAQLQREAQHQANAALHAIEHFNIVGALEHGLQALEDEASYWGERLLQVTNALGSLGSWQPYPLEPTLEPRGAAEPRLAWSPESVQGDLESLGGFFVSSVVNGFEDFVKLADGAIEEGVRAVKRAEAEVSQAISDAQKMASNAFDDLERAAERAAANLTHVVYSIAWHVGQAIEAIAQDEIVGLEYLGGEFKQWVTANKQFLEAFSTVMGDIATVAGVLSLIPGVGEIMLPVALVATGLKTLDDVALASTGNDSWANVGWDAAGIAMFGAGEALSTGAKGLTTLGKASDEFEQAGVRSAAATARADDAVEQAVQASGADRQNLLKYAANQYAKAGQFDQAAQNALHTMNTAGQDALHSELQSLSDPMQTARNAITELRTAGPTKYVSSAWRQGVQGAGGGLYKLNLGIQGAWSFGHDLPEMLAPAGAGG